MFKPKAGYSRYMGLIALVAIALPAASRADTMSFSWAELAYVDSEFGNLNGDGISLRGSLPVNDTFFVFASSTPESGVNESNPIRPTTSSV